MILHIMAPFRTHFKLYTEEIYYNPSQYNLFWDKIKKSFIKNNYDFEKISLQHAKQENVKNQSRFRTVDQNSLARPLEVISFVCKANDKEIGKSFEEVKNLVLATYQLDKEVELIPDSVVIKLFNNSTALLEFEVKTNNFFKNQEGSIDKKLDALQEFGVTLGEKLSQLIYHSKIEPFLRDLIRFPNSSQFIILSLFEFEKAQTKGILIQGSTSDNYLIKVNWVTRTLLIESDNEDHLSDIINHWLKDSGDKEMAEQIQNNPKACAFRWLNYLFRESSYSRHFKTDGSIDYEKPFNDEWEAMLISQYYYCAFEALNDSLHATLAAAFIKRKVKNKQDIKKLNRKLERDVIDAHETIIEYQNNFAYYKRNVGNYIKEIMRGWDFEESILNQIKVKIELCEQRIDILHKKASARSSLYTDMLLLSIAFISIIAFMFQVIEYGRNMSHNADLAVYDSNSLNLVNILSERPTDFAITISLGLIIIIFIAYYLFRRIQVLD